MYVCVCVCVFLFYKDSILACDSVWVSIGILESAHVFVSGAYERKDNLFIIIFSNTIKSSWVILTLKADYLTAYAHPLARVPTPWITCMRKGICDLLSDVELRDVALVCLYLSNISVYFSRSKYSLSATRVNHLPILQKLRAEIVQIMSLFSIKYAWKSLSTITCASR